MQVLVVLARHSGRVVARDELIATCWAGLSVAGDSLNRCILAIRHLARASGAFSITTVSRVGYRLNDAGPPPAGSASPVELSSGRARLIGRDAEKTELDHLLRRAQQGQGALVLLAGEPGLGKTRLAEEVGAEAARRGALTLTGRCYEAAGAPPYGPFVEILEDMMRRVPRPALRETLGADAAEVAKLLPELRHVFDDIPPAIDLPADQERRYLISSVRNCLERVARRQPLVLLLDDLHWADEATLALLGSVADRLADAPMLILGTHRSAEADMGGAFTAWWSDTHRRRLGQRLGLRPLSEPASLELIGAVAGRAAPDTVAAHIHRITEGNPFFIEEVVKHLAEEGRLDDRLDDRQDDRPGGPSAAPEIAAVDVPQGVRLVIGRRLARLGAEAGRTLATAAVVGPRFGYELLEALQGGGGEAVLDALDAAEAAGVVAADGGGYRFAHELIRQTLLAGLSAPRRRRTHLQVAEAIARLSGRGADAHAADIGHHLLAAGPAADPAQVAHYMLIAGRRALEAGAFDDALRCFQAGLAAAPPGANRARGDLLFGRGLVSRHTARAWKAGRDAFRGAIEIYKALGDADAVAEVCLWLTGQLGRAADFDGAAEVCEQGLAAIGERPSAMRINLLCDYAFYGSLRGDYRPGAELFAQARVFSDQLGDPIAAMRMAHRRAQWLWSAGEWRDASQAALEVMGPLRERRDFWRLADIHGRAITALLSQARWADAAALMDEGESLGQRFNFVAWFQIQGARGWSGLAQGEGPAEFAGFAEAMWRRCEETRSRVYFTEARVGLGLSAWWQGRAEAALGHFEAGVRDELPGLFEGKGWGALLLFRARTGQFDAAQAMLDARPDALRPPDEGALVSMGAWDLISATAESLVVMRRPEAAARFYPALAAYQERGAVVRQLDGRLLQTVVAMTAAAVGRWAEAERHFQAALAFAERSPHPLEQAATRWDWAQALLARGEVSDRPRAVELLREAAVRYERLGMTDHSARARAALADLAAPEPF